MISQVQQRWSYSFIIGLALFIVCLAYIPQWKSYAPQIHGSVPTSPYLTPWTVLSVSTLSLALAFAAAPVRSQRPVQTIISKTLALLVFCLSAVFLLEYASGIRVPDLDIFFLPDVSGQPLAQYAARPTQYSATTSLLYSAALIFLNRDETWRMRVFLFGAMAALLLPILGALGYLLNFAFPPPKTLLPRIGLSLPAVILYLTLGSGFLGLRRRPKVLNPDVTQTPKVFGRRFSLRKR
jgi:hypothetical protein